MHYQHDHDQQSIAAPASVQHEFVGLNQDNGRYYFFREGDWRLCPFQNPYAIAKVVAHRQQDDVFMVSNSSPMVQLDPIDMRHCSEQQSTSYVESPQAYDSPHNQYFALSAGYQVIHRFFYVINEFSHLIILFRMSR
jgi:hypothetical protein